MTVVLVVLVVLAVAGYLVHGRAHTRMAELREQIAATDPTDPTHLP